VITLVLPRSAGKHCDAVKNRNGCDIKYNALAWPGQRANQCDPFGTIRQCFHFLASACHLIQGNGLAEIRDMLISVIEMATMLANAATHATCYPAAMFFLLMP
jgi:hypothetical protein